jgi:hypothetical protein
MNRQTLHQLCRYFWLFFVLAAWPVAGSAQVAVAEIEEFEELPTVSAEELETLVGPIALYPDDLLAIVLPASTFPLQVVAAERFLEDLESDPSLKPDEDWDDSIVALLNYPEVVELLNEDLDWTWRLGEAVVAQQADIISAIELFRDRAYAAGNLKSDDYQLVAHEGSSIQITPVEEDVIYVPYYEPEEVVVYQPRPTYYYYPRPYPVYYYPYPAYHSFHDSFWGVTTAFAIGWHTHHLNVFHHSFYGHPYYGHSYWDRYWYRRPDIHVYNNVYVRNSANVSYNRYREGDRWQPNVRRTLRSSDQRVTRTRYYPNSNTPATSAPSRNTNSFASTNSSPRAVRGNDSQRRTSREARREIQFRERSELPAARRSEQTPVQTAVARQSRSRQPQIRESQQRQPQVRESQSNKQHVTRSEPRQPQVRRSEPRQQEARPAQPRQREVRQAERKHSAPKAESQKRSRPEQSHERRSERVAQNSLSRKSSRDR